MRISVITMVFLCLWTGRAQAQDKLVLDVSAAREHALLYNRNIKNSGLAIDQSQERLREAISAGLPQVNASADYSNAMGAQISIQFDENMPPTQIPIRPTSNFNLQVGQLIFNGNYIVGIQLAKLGRILSEKNLKKTEQDVVSQVTESYFLTLLSEESLRILRNNTENLKDIYRKTEPLVKVGMMDKLELDQLSVQVNSLSNAVRSAERQFEMAKNMLRIQMGVTAETELELTDNLVDIIEKEIGPDSDLNFDMALNADYQLLEVQEELTEKQIDLQKAAYLPTVTGFLQLYI
jgi:outer membrane protein